MGKTENDSRDSQINKMFEKNKQVPTNFKDFRWNAPNDFMVILLLNKDGQIAVFYVIEMLLPETQVA